MATLDEIRAEPDPKIRATLRAGTVRDAILIGGIAPLVRDGLRLEFQGQPGLVLDKLGNIIGIDVMVRAFRGAVEVPIDPHRVFVNPPTQVPDGTFHIEIDPDGLERRVKNFRFDPRAAIIEALWQSVVGVPNAPGWRTRGTVTTVFATAPGGEGACESNNNTYATARTGGTLVARANNRVGQTQGGLPYRCWEAFIIFDTSPLPDTDDVTVATLSMDGTADASAVDFNAIAATSTYNGGAVVTTDWISGADLAALTTLASWNSSGYSADYNAFTSVAAFLTAINKTGNTSIILYSDRHSAGNTPTGNEELTFTDADAAGTTSDAKLDITHAAGGGGTVVKDIIGAGIIPFPR